jgi:hypothetical protein
MQADSTEAPLCEACGYNLTGLTGNVCPECGREFVLSQFEQSRIPWARPAAIGKSRAYWLTLAQVLLRPGAMAKRAGGDVARAVDDADAFRRAITWLVSISTALMFGIVFCVMAKRLWEAALLLAIGTPLTAFLTAIALTAAIECTRVYRVQFPENNLQYLSESLLCYGFAPLALLPISAPACYAYGVIRHGFAAGAAWAALGVAIPFFVSWISVVRLTRTLTGGSPQSIARVVLLVPLAWVIIAVLWCALAVLILSITTNLL